MAREPFQNLSEPMYLILLGLLQPRHGYALMQYIEAITNSRVRVGAGTMYGLLSRFEEHAWIVRVAKEEGRNIYQITELGRSNLLQEQLRLEEMALIGKHLLEGEQL